MFFYLYMITVFLEMLLVTGIIPTASAVYPVRTYSNVNHNIYMFCCCLTHILVTVVYGRTRWFNKCHILVLIVERFCWFPICRRWYAMVSLVHSYLIFCGLFDCWSYRHLHLQRNRTLQL